MAMRRRIVKEKEKKLKENEGEPASVNKGGINYLNTVTCPVLVAFPPSNK